MRTISSTAAVALTLLVALSGCRQESSTEATPGAATSSAPAASTTPAPAPAEAQGTPIAKDDIGIRIELVGEPTYSEADDTFNAHLKVTNSGNATWPAKTTLPVHIGAVLLVGEGDKPERRDAGRVLLPSDLAAGSSVELDAKLPAESVVGGKLQFEGLQENVAWFGVDYGQPTLVVGPFQRCAQSPKSLCNESGTALAKSP